ncbi:glycosyl hydrolase [Pleomorphovibrio marinus]|uniref:glycosyl hydrolase n=1 Tax=Pleomorphovibrio marinus TaxID=2164132 RepID=UPI000E0BE4AC|nr:glycosyl hydrolase [Pleomorphovibrio marinus]
MKQRGLSIGIIIFWTLFLSCKTPEPPSEIAPGVWPEISQTAKPWSRWWWMGSAVDKENLSALLLSYHEAGIGGLEIAPIYGAKGHEDKFIEYLSPAWKEMLSHTVVEAEKYGMGIDLTQGTGWPFGGPMVNPESAAQRLIHQEYDWSPSLSISLEANRAKRFRNELICVMGFPIGSDPVELTDKVSEDGKVNWEHEGEAKVIALYMAQTGQQVKRAAPGGQGFTLDHFSEEAVSSYLRHFDDAFEDGFPNFRAFYNDSFEVYGADFTREFFEYFETKRGYDLREYLPELLGEGEDINARIKSDYRETIHEMLLDNFTKQWTNWAHDQGKKTKNQAHGSPGNLLDLYATVDIPEGETFGSSYFPIPGLRRDSADIRNVDPDPIMLKFAASAAHLTGKKLVSSETFTWLGEHFKSSFSQAKPELEQAFLGGVNHMFYHGITYSPKDIEFPGWLFYASLNLNTHNSLWPHFKGFNEYIARCQSVLQAGQPEHEVLMYWPVYDIWHDDKGLSKMITVHNIDEWLHPTAFYQESNKLIQSGYGVDFISDAFLQNVEVSNNDIQLEGGAIAKVLVVPTLKRIPLSTIERLFELAASGATVIFQTQPKDIPGYLDHENRRVRLEELWGTLSFKGQIAEVGKGKVYLGEDILSLLHTSGIQRETLADTGLQFVKRVSGKRAFYYLVNHTADPIERWIALSKEGNEYLIMDPQQGALGRAIRNKQDEVLVQIPSGETRVIQVLEEHMEGLQDWDYYEGRPDVLEIQGPWMVRFDGGPSKPSPIKMNELVTWTLNEDLDAFSGLGTYETSFTVDRVKNEVLYLDLGVVRESARVWINEQEVGYAYGLPFRLEVGDFVKEGENHLKVEVANLMANRIRHMDRKGEVWRNYHEINFVNIDYEPFDATEWELMPSGLLGPVKLLSFQRKK